MKKRIAKQTFLTPFGLTVIITALVLAAALLLAAAFLNR
jgi:hypothetical protein